MSGKALSPGILTMKQCRIYLVHCANLECKATNAIVHDPLYTVGMPLTGENRQWCFVIAPGTCIVIKVEQTTGALQHILTNQIKKNYKIIIIFKMLMILDFKILST